MLIGIFLFIALKEFNSNLNNDKPIGLSLVFLIFTLAIGGFMIYSIFNVYKLKRIKGISRVKNSNLIERIAKKNKWNISTNNQQITIINFSWKDSGTDWGKQMTIIYDRTDLLVNCISFGLNSSPSPFHWFANKRKVNELTTEFENGKKTFYNNI
ncbi:hypothetical protein GCM10023163_19210 [Aestuariibaculum suncheonense]